MQKKATLLIVLFIVAGGALLAWRSDASGPLSGSRASVHPDALMSLTADDVVQILQSETGRTDGELPLSANEESRKAFLQGIREYLALAAEARSKSLHADPVFKANFAYKTDLLLADLYDKKLSLAAGKVYLVPRDEIDAVWQDPANAERFPEDMEMLRAIQIETLRLQGSEIMPEPLAAGSLEKARENWARAKVLSAKARSDAEFMGRHATELRTRILEAGILSADLLRSIWAEKIAATDAEIDRYLGAHPEYDIHQKIERAKQVLVRVKNGEDLAALAKEFSEHRPTADIGGLIENIEPGTSWLEVEAAVARMKPGQIAGTLIESENGYHIVRLERMNDGRPTIRHILFQNRFEGPRGNDPGPPPPFMTAKEIAKMEVERMKRDEFVLEVTKRHQISMPEDFTGQ